MRQEEKGEEKGREEKKEKKRKEKDEEKIEKMPVREKGVGLFSGNGCVRMAPK